MPVGLHLFEAKVVIPLQGVGSGYELVDKTGANVTGLGLRSAELIRYCTSFDAGKRLRRDGFCASDRSQVVAFEIQVYVVMKQLGPLKGDSLL